MLLVLLTIVLIGIAGWGFNSVLLERAKWRPMEEPFDSIADRLAVDPYIWSAQAPRWLRRRYVVTQACGIAAALCLAALVWLAETNASVQFWGATAFVAVSLIGFGGLAWKVVRNGGF